ncbi:STAS domain-containing protein [Vibrio quintilis]|uniref:STAS domain protein n=1 Tax=Vibrio quintilis TaxID=1117707 RepID=A0A1M7YR47_9VIBR|nr:STAS domain-containing protein [Vibrio quintilis]SHO55077.1 STAS domain protein [Vibrio quintilis]
MELNKINDNDIRLTLQFNGNLDADGTRNIQPVIDEIIWAEPHREVELDFSAVQFMDSSGVGALVYLYKRLIEKKRNMRIENASGQPLEIIHLLRISNTIAVNSHTH